MLFFSRHVRGLRQRPFYDTVHVRRAIYERAPKGHLIVGIKHGRYFIIFAYINGGEPREIWSWLRRQLGQQSVINLKSCLLFLRTTSHLAPRPSTYLR